jgi:glutaminase
MTYAIARTVLDCDLVHEYVGQEPSGRNDLEFALDYQSKTNNIICFKFDILYSKS